MRKVKFVALVLSAAVMLMGAGYAAWTENVIINNNVSTGDLSVKFEDGTVNVFADAAEVAEPASITRTATALSDGDATETVTVTNLYPGAHVHVSIPVANDGSIPAKGTDLTPAGVPAWVTLTENNAVVTIDPGAKANLTYEFTVTDDAPEATPDVQFTLTGQYTQWNQ